MTLASSLVLNRRVRFLLGLPAPTGRPFGVSRSSGGLFFYVTYFDDAYPEQLRRIFQLPLILFYRGNLRALRLPALAVVAIRTATPYGFSCLCRLLPGVIEHGVAIVSGLAREIDVMAHQVTFSNRGVPIAVIGSGLNHAYTVRTVSYKRRSLYRDSFCLNTLMTCPPIGDTFQNETELLLVWPLQTWLWK